jgi:hypothetical protein
VTEVGIVDGQDNSKGLSFGVSERERKDDARKEERGRAFGWDALTGLKRGVGVTSTDLTGNPGARN